MFKNEMEIYSLSFKATLCLSHSTERALWILGPRVWAHINKHLGLKQFNWRWLNVEVLSVELRKWFGSTNFCRSRQLQCNYTLNWIPRLLNFEEKQLQTKIFGNKCNLPHWFIKQIVLRLKLGSTLFALTHKMATTDKAQLVTDKEAGHFLKHPISFLHSLPFPSKFSPPQMALFLWTRRGHHSRLITPAAQPNAHNCAQFKFDR